jgi:hypothetical protein
VLGIVLLIGLGEGKQKQVPDILEPVCIFRAGNITALTPLR